MKTTIHGTYHRLGYELHRNGEQFYSAGNMQHDSQFVGTPGEPGVLTLAQIRSLCLKETEREVSDRLKKGEDVWLMGIERTDK